MEKFSNEYFQTLARALMFDLNEKEINELRNDFTSLEDQLALLSKIDTDVVAPMVYPFEMETTFLRVDEVENVVSQDAALLNAAKVENGMIGVPKVVK